MKTSEELRKLSNAIGEASPAYHKAVEENLKESSKEHNVIGDDEDYDGICRQVRDGDDVDNVLVDKVRWNKVRGYVEYRCSEWNYNEADEW